MPKSAYRDNNTVEWRKGQTVIVDAGVLHDYERVWKLGKKRVREELKMKRKRKDRFLEKKYGRSRGTPDQLKEITIADREIPATFTSEPKCYGGCSIDEKEKKILSLPPKFAVCNGVNTTQCEAEIEKGLAKRRWTKRKQFEMDGENKDQTEEERRAVYDIKSKTFDFCSMKATDLPFNKRVHLPEPLEEESEIAIRNLKVKLNQLTAEYVEGERLDKWNNLRKDEREGLVSLKKKVQTQENVVFQTDKSGRFSVDNLENYKAASQSHIVDSIIITKDEHDRLQQLVNWHSVSWVRILSAGSETSNGVRIKNNMISNDSSVAPL